MRRLPRTLLPLAAIASLALSAAPAPAATGIAPARGFASRQLLVKFEGQRHGGAVELGRGIGVREAARALRRNPNVVYAVPNYIASSSAVKPPPYDPDAPPFDPDDTGSLAGVAPEASSTSGDWIYKQWNFLAYDASKAGRLPVSPGGIDAPGAWRNLIERGRPGAAGVVVAVLDSGIAYRSLGTGFRRSPDFGPRQFVPGYDFVDRDRIPLDESGHGTHVAGTIAEKTGNGVGVTGLAYRAKLMPVRVLDRNGFGDALDIAKGIRFATRHGAQVINMSFNFDCGKAVPLVDEALREAFEAGVVAVASAGNLGSESCVSAPATGPRVIGVGGTTEGGCLGDYSLAGRDIDLVAPGGGVPQSRCPSVAARPIYQVTLQPKSTKEFGIPAYYVGTSMAAAHVSGVAAMVLASGVVNPVLPPAKKVEVVARKLRQTARDLGLPRTQQGAGLLDAAAATGAFPVFARAR
ncbi:MAG TPA: S8 family serine peptidase [Solirubrobacterales bacterium]|nr:S8 family serine peptidase [Solirubrobacterales bacterium]